MSADVAIIGIGIHPFGRHPGVSGEEMARIAVGRALRDAGVGWRQIEFAFGGSVGGAPYVSVPAAQVPDALVRQLGMTGIPFVNVVNGCATAGSAIWSAANAIRSGEHDLGLVVGFDKHPRGHFNVDPAYLGLPEWYGQLGLMVTTQFFAMKIARYMHEYGITAPTLGKVAAKAYRNGAANPNAWRRTPFTEEEILNAPMINRPLTQYMFCSPDEGAAAVVACRADQAQRYTTTPIYLRAACVRTRQLGSFDVFGPSFNVPPVDTPTVAAARAAFAAAGIGPEEVDVVQIQDSEAGAEVMHMAECGFCADGEQEKLVQDGETDLGGRLPVNTDGGLIANGEPVGASGMRQVYETVLQLRGQAGDRQVPGHPQVGFTHVYGAPGVAATTILSR